MKKEIIIIIIIIVIKHVFIMKKKVDTSEGRPTYYKKRAHIKKILFF